MESRSGMVWRRLDVPGRDAATLNQSEKGWLVVGEAEFVDEGRACRLQYSIDLSPAWHTRSVAVAGSNGERKIDLAVRVDRGQRWTMNWRQVPSIADCLDIDLAFTPATNTLPIRRLDLPVGESARVVAAWLRFPELDLEPLEQVYRRVDANHYDYRAPESGFQAVLTVTPEGWVVDYPGLWVANAR